MGLRYGADSSETVRPRDIGECDRGTRGGDRDDYVWIYLDVVSFSDARSLLSQVRRVAPALLQRILSHIVRTIAEELARLMSCVTLFRSAGIIQARTDIVLLRNALRAYSTNGAR